MQGLIIAIVGGILIIGVGLLLASVQTENNDTKIEENETEE